MSSFSHHQQNDDDFEAVTRISNTDLLLQCPLCKKDFQDPRILCSNGHTFCYNCIQHVLPANGILKCPVCNESRRLSSVQEIGQLTKNHTLQTLKRAEHHRIAQLGICELCNKKPAYGRCFHCRSLACFKCMDDHARVIAAEHGKEYAELIEIRDNLNEKISHWDKKLIELRNNIHSTVQTDAEKQIKEIKDREQVLCTQLDDLYQNYSTVKNTKLQKLKLDMEKESNELDKIDPKNWNTSDRIRLSRYWIDLQQKLDDQYIEFIYKPTSTSINQPHLGELHLKTSNQENEHLQIPRLQRQQINNSNLFDNQDSLISETVNLSRRTNHRHPSTMTNGREANMKIRKRMIITEQNPSLNNDPFFTQSPPTNYDNDNEGAYRGTGHSLKFSTSGNRSQRDGHQREQEGNEYATRKVVRKHHQQQTSHHHLNMALSNGFEQQIEDTTPLTPRMPVAPISLGDYSKKATHVLSGPNEADKFLAPKAIAVTETNQLLIADTKKHRLVIYDLNLKTMRGIKGFLFPDGLCSATEKYVIITDRHRVSKYDWVNGRMISFIGSKKEGCTRSTFSWPKGVAIDNDYVFVCDSYNSRVVILTHQMRYESEWTITRDTKKLDPQYISISNGLLYITAWQRIKPESCAYNAGCIIVYSPDGNPQRFIDTDAQSYLNLSVPEGIVCDSSNQLILADRYTSKILAMNDGNQEAVLHFHGDRMKAPHYVCFSNDQNTMIVTDVGNNTVQFYEKNK